LAEKIKWSPLAAKDVEDIAAFIARGSEFYAKAVVSRIIYRIHEEEITILTVVHGKRLLRPEDKR